MTTLCADDARLSCYQRTHRSSNFD